MVLAFLVGRVSGEALRAVRLQCLMEASDVARVISVHSFRGGTGRTSLVASCAALMATQGLRVGLADLHLSAPSAHVPFGLREDQVGYTVNDFLLRKCEPRQLPRDVSLTMGVPVSGQLFLVPASVKPVDIIRIGKSGYDIGLLKDGLHDIVEELQLDILFIDSPPGLTHESLAAAAIADIVITLLRADQQDFQGTLVSLDVLGELGVPQTILVLNKLPASVDPVIIRPHLEKLFGMRISAIIPQSEELAVLGTAGVFAMRHPEHRAAQAMRQIVQGLT